MEMKRGGGAFMSQRRDLGGSVESFEKVGAFG